MDAASDLPTGTRLAGRYRLDEKIGRGGMAVVYRAHDEVLGRAVAVKVMTNATATPDALQRQFSEAQIGAALNHPGLVTIYDVHPNDVPPFLVMELVEGMTLGDALKRGKLKPEAVAEIGAQLCAALAAVHRSGIVHRDIKPTNVLLVSDAARTVKLTDFGISLLVDATRITAAGSLVGTARYLSPEQVLGQKVDRPTDIYALGLVLIECLSGESVFPGTQAETMSARLHRAPELPAGLPSGWARVLTAMTSREPEARPDALTVAQALRALADGRVPQGIGAADDAVTQAAAVPSPPPQATRQQTAYVPPPAAAPAPAEPPRAMPEPIDRRADRKGGCFGKAVLAILLLILAAVVAIAIWLMPIDTPFDMPGGDDPSDSPTPGQDDDGRNPNNQGPADPQDDGSPTEDAPPSDDGEVTPSGPDNEDSPTDESPTEDTPTEDTPPDDGTITEDPDLGAP